MYMTKKQTNALLDIISNYQFLRDHKTNALNENRDADEPPVPHHFCGEIVTPSGCMVTDGYVGVFYPSPVPGLPHDEDYRQEDNMVRRIFTEEVEYGNYSLVSSPFPGEISTSEIRKLLKEHSVSDPKDPFFRRQRITLAASDENGSSVEGDFNSLFVRRAVEAVGSGVRLYIGSRPNNPKTNRMFLLVVPKGSNSFDPDWGVHAIVMPLRR